MATSESQNPSSSSLNPEFRGRYDIFLSFRGLDTRYDFTDHLYHALMHEGFQTFRDDDEIERGEVIKSELLEAIRNSRMSVIVLSENYANSTACLFELQTIFELCKKTDHVVLPVFYKVEPWVLKEQSKNLIFEKKEVAADKAKGWSAVLKEVASMAGMVFRKESTGYEAEFIKKIVGVLKNKLAGKHLRVDDHLVGVDSRTKHVDSWLKDRSTRAGVLVIRGMGGIGKTTFAKVLYNSNYGSYDAACFLPNIRDVAKEPDGLVRLQRKLLSNILKKEERKLDDVFDGCRRMKYVLTNKRVLLVLDDVDHADHIFALAGKQDWFMPGSKIIITTRLESLMNADHEIYKVYRLEKLSDDESLELFSWHAFRQKHPIQSHIALSKRFVQYCDGLPLALQVLGSSCREKSIDVWESDLHKLQADSDYTILEKLKISYDSLQDNHDQNLFLEIACFFAGKKKNDTIAILEGCDYFALAGIHNLVDRNLLTIENEKLGMHQLLQDMGKQIVCQESKHPEKRSRIWRHMESFSVLSENIGTKKIEGLILDMNMLRISNKDIFKSITFEKMYNLRLLKLSSVQLSGTFRAFPKRLRWLYWRGFPSESFPNDFPLENLVNLDLRYSNLKQVWRGTKALGSLKILNLSHSPRLEKIPDFSRIPNLEKLILKACPSLFEVDESLVKLKRLESLNLRDCKNLRKLPRNMNTVESLVEINISGCSNLMGAIEELEKMKSLRVLHASRMDIDRFLTKEVVSQGFILPWVPKPRIRMSLASLPSSLTHLNLSHCNLTENAFPEDFGKLSKLQQLFLGGNPVSRLPNFIKDLTALQMLDLSWCPKLQHILFPPIGLNKLVVTECRALEKITYETSASIKFISHGACMSLDYVQHGFKILPVKKVDVELINKIGFFNLDSMANVEAFVVNTIVWSRKKCPIQILQECYIFSTFFPGREVPPWFSYRNCGSTVSLTMTSSSAHCRISGLNLCLVYTVPENLDWLPEPLEVEVCNKSQRMKRVYAPRCYGIPEAGGDMVWLSHWLPGSTLFKEGDELEVLFNLKVDGKIKECGVHILYFREDEMGKYFSTIYHSWDSKMFRFVNRITEK
ncbi:disease resistance protein RPV1-like [Rhododendron vialii]|uniref:disease resistance protein RPV1-like n=1 Tax=Rhododendron vialii TaxID=182163 RepID=UPI00265D77E6|nr:disease resistance protein RPV1-like [Rhododendron vialii]